MKMAAERLLARLVPKDRASRIGAERAADESEREQICLTGAPLAATRTDTHRPHLVDLEGCKGREVDRHE